MHVRKKDCSRKFRPIFEPFHPLPL